MKKAIIIISCVIFALAGAGVIIHTSTLDGLDGFVWSKFFQEDTVFSSGYSDRAFKRITKGMPQAEVKRLLGEPLKTYPPDKFRDWTSFCYSQSPGDTHYRMRAINFRDGLVVNKHSEFYVD